MPQLLRRTVSKHGEPESRVNSRARENWPRALLEDVFNFMRLLCGLLANQGTIYMETQMSAIQSELPIFETPSTSTGRWPMGISPP